MRANLVQLVFEGELAIEDLTDEEQEQILQDYNMLATHWVESPKDGLNELGREILRMIESADLELPMDTVPTILH